MPQIHLDGAQVRRIMDEDQVAIIVKSDFALEKGTLIHAREPWAIIDGRFIYQADNLPHLRKVKWQPSIFLDSKHQRLFLTVLDFKFMHLSEITDDVAKDLGHTTAKDAVREWNKNLKKEDRPLYGSKANPFVCIVYVDAFTNDIP